MKDYNNITIKKNITTEIIIETTGDYFAAVIDTEIKSVMDNSTTERLTIKRYKDGVKIYARVTKTDY